MPALLSPRDDPHAFGEGDSSFYGTDGRYDGGGYRDDGHYDEGYREDSGFDAYGYRGNGYEEGDDGYDKRAREQHYDDGYYDERHREGMRNAPGTPRTARGAYDDGDYPPLSPGRRRDEYDDYDRSEAYDDYTADYSLPRHGTEYTGPRRGESYGSGRQSNDFSVQDPDVSYASGGRRRQRRDPPSVAGSVAPDPGGDSSAAGIPYSGAISTASASAITFDTRSSASRSAYTSMRSRGTRSKSARSGEGSRRRDDEKATSTADRHTVIPISVSFPAKGGAGGTGRSSEAGASERSAVEEKVDEISATLRRYIGHDESASPASRKDSRGSGGRRDAPSARQSPRSGTKPRPPLRRPDAAKSRETMTGRGKSGRSAASSVQKSRGSRSRELRRGDGTRNLTDGIDDGGTERGERRGLSRGRAARHLTSAEGCYRRDDRRRGRGRGDRSVISGDASVKSHSTHSSWRSIRHDVDDEGRCVHHPHVRLYQLTKRGKWRVLRKKCPECIAEDCPAMLGRDDDDRGRAAKTERRRKHHVSSSDIYHVSERGEYDASKSIASSAAPSSMGALDTFRELGLSFQTPEEMEEEEATNRLKRRLAARAYHFPGNTWCQDWMQYLSNTHTVLGLFFHHPLHPMGFQERLVILFGSIAIGLTISNFTYLYFIRNGIDVEEEVFTLNSRHTDMTGIPVVSITKLMITLWTLGSFLHTCFDLGLWHMKACTLCRYRGRVDERMATWGRVAGLFVVMMAMGAGGYAVLLRASIEYKGEGSVADEVEESIQANELYSVEFEDKRSFRFLLGYLVEFVLALFVYYPLAVTILFSGVLGCGGRIPILGGRPREMAKEMRYEMSKRRPKILKAFGGKMEEENGETVASTTDVVPMTFRDDESREWFDENEVI